MLVGHQVMRTGSLAGRAGKPTTAQTVLHDFPSWPRDAPQFQKIGTEKKEYSTATWKIYPKQLLQIRWTATKAMNSGWPLGVTFPTVCESSLAPYPHPLLLTGQVALLNVRTTFIAKGPWRNELARRSQTSSI